MCSSAVLSQHETVATIFWLLIGSSAGEFELHARIGVSGRRSYSGASSVLLLLLPTTKPICRGVLSGLELIQTFSTIGLEGLRPEIKRRCCVQ